MHTKSQHSMVYVVFASLLLDLLAFTMILPLLPSLLDYYKKNDPANGFYSVCSEAIQSFHRFVGAPDRFNTVIFGGALGSLFSFLQFLVSPLAGGLSDVYGRKPLLLISLVGISFSYVLWALSQSFLIFVIARIVGGLSKGNVSLSMAIITDISTPATRASGMALVGIAFSIGFLIGPVIGACFASWAQTQSLTDSPWYIIPALCALTFSVIDLIFVLLFFKETLPKNKRAKSVAQSLAQAASYINIPSLFKFSAVTKLTGEQRRELQLLGMVYFDYLFIYSGLEFTLTFLTHHTFNYTAAQQGKMFFFIGIIMSVIQGAWVRRVPQEKVKAVAIMGLLFIIPSYVLVGFATNGFILYAGLFLYSVSTSMVVPCMTTLASQFGGDEQKGTVMGIFRSLGALARAVGPIVASIAYWSLGSRTTYCIGSVALIVPWYKLKSSVPRMKTV